MDINEKLFRNSYYNMMALNEKHLNTENYNDQSIEALQKRLDPNSKDDLKKLMLLSMDQIRNSDEIASFSAASFAQEYGRQYAVLNGLKFMNLSKSPFTPPPSSSSSSSFLSSNEQDFDEFAKKAFDFMKSLLPIDYEDRIKELDKELEETTRLIEREEPERKRKNIIKETISNNSTIKGNFTNQKRENFHSSTIHSQSLNQSSSAFPSSNSLLNQSTNSFKRDLKTCLNREESKLEIEAENEIENQPFKSSNSNSSSSLDFRSALFISQKNKIKNNSERPTNSHRINQSKLPVTTTRTISNDNNNNNKISQNPPLLPSRIQMKIKDENNGSNVSNGNFSNGTGGNNSGNRTGSINNRNGNVSNGNASLSKNKITDDRLANVDPKLIETIENEIISQVCHLDWDDIVGLEHAKKTIKEIIIWPMQRPDIFTGLRGPPKGLLLFGPPGTGKTMIGKCIASQVKATFFSISASCLTSKWIGEGEKLVRALFTVARCHQPSVIFIDEIDSILTQRTDGEFESSRRIKTEFLVQFDGVSGTRHEDQILIIGATNRPQELDEAVRRRLVKRLYIPLPESEARIQLFRNLLNHQRHEITDDEFVELSRLTDGYSGSDLDALCREAALGPIRTITNIATIDANMLPPITINHFIMGLDQVRASVSSKDLDAYIDWNSKYGSLALNK